MLALALIVAGGFAILGRLHLTHIAVGFWLAFAAGIGVLAVSGHTMTAAWHVGPIEGVEFWWTLVSSPEILVFLFFMITDPRTIPASRAGRRAYAVGVGLLATLLIAPFTTEFATKVAVLGALFLVCAARPVLVVARLDEVGSRTMRRHPPAGRPSRAPSPCSARSPSPASSSPPASQRDRMPEAASAALPRRFRTSRSPTREGSRRSTSRPRGSIARDVVADLRIESEALERGDLDRAADGASGEWLAALWQRIREASDSADRRSGV